MRIFWGARCGKTARRVLIGAGGTRRNPRPPSTNHVISAEDNDSLDKKKRCASIIESYDIIPDEVLYVGDTYFDILLAQGMGFDSCLVNNDISWINKQPDRKNVEPKYTISDLRSTPNIAYDNKY